MDKVLVTLLLIVLAVGALVSIEIWFSNHRDNLINDSNTIITNIIDNT